MISIDIPSGLNANTGCPVPVAICAAMTVTSFMNPVLVTGRGKQYVGQLQLAKLGVGQALEGLHKSVGETLSLAVLPPLPERAINSYKTQCGKLLCCGGNQLMPGAIRLSAIGALRVGTGMVKINCHPIHNAMMTIPQLN